MSDLKIRVIREPKVYLVARPDLVSGQFDFLADEGVGDWRSDTGREPEYLVELAGRVCYWSFAAPRPGGNRAYIVRLLEAGHGSVLEHASWSFVLAGISRTLSHELVRHRAGWSYSMLSQRYVDESEVAFVMPPAYLPLPPDHAAVDEWSSACDCALQTYRELVEIAETLPCWRGMEDRTLCRKMALEAARSVLPGCTGTKLFATANARALRHFLELRGGEHADAEIRRLALAMLAILKAESPHIFGDYRIEDVPGIGPCIRTDHRKV